MAEGKPFNLNDHRKTLMDLGLTKPRDELKAEAAAGQKPPGQPKKVGSTLVYPARHFG
jgi:hypothetical protein